MMKRVAVALFALLPSVSLAQNVYPTADGHTAAAMTVMGCVNASGVAVPANGNTCSVAVTITGPDGPEGGVSVSINPFREDSTNFAGTITVGGAWQQVAPANPMRQRFFMQNYCGAATQGIAATESIFLAVRASMPTVSPLVAPAGTELVTCGSYDTSAAVVSVSPVWVWAATTNHRFQALEW